MNSCLPACLPDFKLSQLFLLLPLGPLNPEDLVTLGHRRQRLKTLSNPSQSKQPVTLQHLGLPVCREDTL